MVASGWFFIELYRWVPSILQVLTIVRPETLVRWHRAGLWDIRCHLPAQPVDATQALNLSAGVSNCKVSRGRSLS